MAHSMEYGNDLERVESLQKKFDIFNKVRLVVRFPLIVSKTSEMDVSLPP